MNDAILIDSAPEIVRHALDLRMKTSFRPPKDGTALVAYFHRDDNRQKTMTLEADEFIRRFLIHVLPDRFHRIECGGSDGATDRLVPRACSWRVQGKGHGLSKATVN
jgi:hypothetical protein